jgi:hypothetical protein
MRESTAAMRRKEVKMARGGTKAATNEHIVRLLESVRSDLAALKRQQERLERNVGLLVKKAA